MSWRNVLNGAQVIVDYLIQEKVPYAFGLCGHGNIQFIDALYERSHDIKTISVHHESVAGFMADAYYRVSGKPLATFTSCGPGSANLPISLATAYLDSVPFLAVTGNVRPASLIAAPSRKCTASIRPISPPWCGQAASGCFSRRAARWCRSPCGRPGRPW